MQGIILENFGGPEHFKMRELPDPQAKAGEVRIRIASAAFNPVDVKMREGAYGGKLPLILGMDCSGVIDQIGAQVQGFSIGEEVVAMASSQASNGTYALSICLPASFVAKKPKNLSFDQAASFPLISMTAYRALIASDILQKGDSLFMVGAGGGVGSFAVELAKHRGASSIFTIAKDTESQQFLIDKLGLKKENIVIYSGLTQEQIKENILQRNGGRPFDVTCDFVGGNIKPLCMELCRHSGRFTTIVPEKEGYSLDAWVRGSLPFKKNLTVHFTFVFAESFSDDKEAWKRYAQHLRAIAEWLDQKVLNPPSITVVGDFSVETVQRAHHILESGAAKGKLIMKT